jgi:hypothetical protein
MTYVGPNPAINGYVRSNGEALRVVSGAASGGASLIVRNDAGINKPKIFTASASRRRNSATRRMLRCATGSRITA